MTAVLIPVCVFASDISDALYHGTIVAYNSSSLTEDVCANVSISTPDLITSGILNSSANNCVIHNSIGSDTAFMPGYSTNPWIVFYDSIGDYGSAITHLYTGNVTGGDIVYFPGSGGMEIDDDATMEPGNDFKTVIRTFLKYGTSDNSTTLYPDAHPETSSVDGFVTHFSDNTAWTTLRSAAGTTANDNTSPYYVSGYKTGSTSLYQDIFRFILVFDKPEHAVITSATLYLYGSDKTDDNASKPNVNIYSAAPASNTAIVAGDYDSTGTTAYSTAISYDDWSTTGYNAFEINAAGLEAINASDDVIALSTRSANYDVANVAPARAGNNLYSYLKIYTADEAGTNKDPKLEITYFLANVINKEGAINSSYDSSGNLTTVLSPATTVTVSGVSEGLHTITYELDAGTFSVTVDSEAPETTAYAGSVPDTADDWIVGSSGNTLYIDYFKHYVNDVLVSDIAWKYSATFTDLSGNGNDATPSFRTSCSNPDVTTTLTSFLPIDEATADYDPDMDWPSMVTETPDQPSTMYSENSTPGVFFASFINSIWPSATIPVSFFWYNFTFATVIIAGIITFRIHPSLLLKIIVMGTIMLLWALPGPNVYGIYVVIYFGLYCFGIMVLSKSYGW